MTSVFAPNEPSFPYTESLLNLCSIEIRLFRICILPFFLAKTVPDLPLRRCMPAPTESYISVFTMGTQWFRHPSSPLHGPLLPQPTCHSHILVPSLSLFAIIYHFGMPCKRLWRSRIGMFSTLSSFFFFTYTSWIFFSLGKLALFEGWCIAWLSLNMTKTFQNLKGEGVAKLIRQGHLSKWFQTWTLDSEYLGTKPGPTTYQLPNLDRPFYP